MNQPPLPRIPQRKYDSHKGQFGHALVIGGSRGMTGAAIIAGQSALRIGAGLVTVATPRSCQSIAASACPIYMTLGLPWRKEFHRLMHPLLQSRFAKAVIAIGPGLGRRPNTDELVANLYLNWPNAMVLDADALNAMCVQWTSSKIDIQHPRSIRVLTPHPGEWSRISHTAATDREGQIESANQFAKAHGCVIVLKGAKTWITDGQQGYENQTGNPSLAVGGSGDCLTGLIAGLICQGMSGFEASVLGVHLHGLAADLAHQELGTPSTLATDLLAYLPKAISKVI